MKLFTRISSMFFALMFASTFSYAEGLEIQNPWVRMPPPVADTAAGYMTLTNNSRTAIEIVSVTSSVSESAEFHSMVMHEGMMHMNKMDDVVIAAGESLVFDTGSNHLMLIGLEHVLHASDMITLSIKTKDNKTYTINAEVIDMRKNAQSQQHHHH